MYSRVSRSLYECGKILYRSQQCQCKLLNNEIVIKKRTISNCRTSYVNKKLNDDENVEKKNNESNLASAFVDKYKVFRDEDAPVIFDVNEEINRIALNELNVAEAEQEDPYADINTTHGISGVYDIDDLVEVLHRERARQIFVAEVPKEYCYVDYIVVVTGNSPRHMNAVATVVRKIYKLKMYKNEIIPKIEGENSKEWLALDLGNIAFHIFSEDARKKYDLETLWAVGSEFDDLCNKKDEEHILEKYKSFLKELQPAE